MITTDNSTKNITILPTVLQRKEDVFLSLVDKSILWPKPSLQMVNHIYSVIMGTVFIFVSSINNLAISRDDHLGVAIQKHKEAQYLVGK